MGAILQGVSGLATPDCPDCTYYQVLGGRALGGLGLGFLLVSVPTYLSELSPPAYRGIGVNIFQLMVNVGILICDILVGTWLDAEDYNWRILISLQAIPGILLMIGVAVVSV